MIVVVFVVVHLVESMCVGEIQQRRNSIFFAVASNKAAAAAVKYYYGCYKCNVHTYKKDILFIIHFYCYQVCLIWFFLRHLIIQMY